MLFSPSVGGEGIFLRQCFFFRFVFFVKFIHAFRFRTYGFLSVRVFPRNLFHVFHFFCVLFMLVFSFFFCLVAFFHECIVAFFLAMFFFQARLAQQHRKRSVFLHFPKVKLNRHPGCGVEIWSKLIFASAAFWYVSFYSAFTYFVLFLGMTCKHLRVLFLLVPQRAKRKYYPRSHPFTLTLP